MKSSNKKIKYKCLSQLMHWHARALEMLNTVPGERKLLSGYKL